MSDQESLQEWIEKGKKVEVSLKVAHQEATTGEVYTYCMNSSERLVHAGKYWGGCWLAALGAVFIPVAHFVLVPLFLIAGPIIGIIKFGQERVILGGRGSCPACSKELWIDSTVEKWPFGEVCSGCGVELSIEAEAESEAEAEAKSQA